MKNFVVGLTNDDPSTTTPVYKDYRYVQNTEKFPANATVSLTFDESADTFRYIVVQTQSSSNNALCLSELKAFVRGK